MAQGKRAQALSTLEGWLQQHKDDGRVRQALAELHMRAGQWSAAAREYEVLIASGVKSAGVYDNYALVLLELGDPRALATAEKAHALAPGDPNVVDTYGWILSRTGRHEEGLRYLREARLRQPDNLDIRLHLARVLHETGRTSEARVEMADSARLPAEQLSETTARFLREIGGGK
jgi:Tfp pilus assembly protein PilF